jgi:hypothetical protein
MLYLQAKAVTEPEQPQLGEDEMADLEKELELDLKNLDVNDAGVRHFIL